MRCGLSEAGRLEKNSGSPKRADNEGPLNTILSRELILRMHFGIGGEQTRSRSLSAIIIGKPARPPNTNASVAQGAGDRPFRQKPGLTRFLPARLSADGATIEPGVSHGSGDVAALARCNAFLVTEPDRAEWAAGDDIRALFK